MLCTLGNCVCGISNPFTSPQGAGKHTQGAAVGAHEWQEQQGHVREHPRR